MKQLIIILSIIMPLTAFAGKVDNVKDELTILSIQEKMCLDSDQGSSTVGIKGCLGERYDALDLVLNREYKAIMKLVVGEEKTRLIQSEKDWLKFRVSNCTWQSSQMLGGTGEGVIYIGCMNKATDDRIKELVEFYYPQID